MLYIDYVLSPFFSAPLECSTEPTTCHEPTECPEPTTPEPTECPEPTTLERTECPEPTACLPDPVTKPGKACAGLLLEGHFVGTRIHVCFYHSPKSRPSD